LIHRGKQTVRLEVRAVWLTDQGFRWRQRNGGRSFNSDNCDRPAVGFSA
jgi:hypothetical protein